MKIIIFLLVFALSASFFASAYSESLNQFTVETKHNFPETIPAGEKIPFTIAVTNKGPYSWVKHMEPDFEVIPSRAHYDVTIEYDEQFTKYNTWINHINRLSGTIEISKDTKFDAIFLSVSFTGDIRHDEKVTSVDPNSTISIKIGEPKSIESQTIFHEADVEWKSRCFLTASPAVVRIVEPDMNNDSNSIETLSVTIWSDFDDREIIYTATETGKDTGVFDADVFLTNTVDETPGKRIRTIDGSTVYARYTDTNFSNNFQVLDVLDAFTTRGLDVLEKDPNGRMSKIVYDTCALVLLEKNLTKFEELDIVYPPPLKQLTSGLHVEEVRCKPGLELLLKLTPVAKPMCVTESTYDTLIQRGWSADANWSS